MGKKDKKKGKGAAKTAAKTDKKLQKQMKKQAQMVGEEDVSESISLLEKKGSLRTEVSLIPTKCPSRRATSSFVAHPDRDEIFLFGGEYFNGNRSSVYNDLFSYNIQKNEWTIIQAPNNPPPRCGHQMIATSIDKGQLWLFGGEYLSESMMQIHHYNDLWIYFIAKKTWQKINAPNAPSPRSGHRMVLSKKQIVVFGGYYDNQANYIYYNDVHIFSLETYSWKSVPTIGTQPAPRSGCCMAALPDGKIIIYGGYSKEKVKKDVDKGIVHSDMFLLESDKTDLTGTRWKWTKVKAGGAKPTPRSGLAMAVAPTNKAYTFGGVWDVEENEEDINGTFYNDLHLLDLEQIVWRTVSLKSRVKKVSEDEDMMDESGDGESIIGEVKTVVDDGIFTVTVGPALPTNSNKISSSKGSANDPFIPCPRMNAGLAIKNGTLYLYGGLVEVEDRTLTLCDFYALDLHKLDGWKTILDDKVNAEEWFSSSESESDSSMSDDSYDSDEEEKMDTD